MIVFHAENSMREKDKLFINLKNYYRIISQ